MSATLSRSVHIVVAAVVVALAPCAPARGAGGTIRLVTDDTPDGYVYSLSGSGNDRFISEYEGPDPFEPSSIVCGARVREHAAGYPPLGTMGGDLRREDPVNPGPDLSPAGLIADVDPESMDTCSTTSARPRFFTFGHGSGIAAERVTQFISAIEPVHGSFPTDFCGVILDTNSPPQGKSKTYSGGTFGAIPWNHRARRSARE